MKSYYSTESAKQALEKLTSDERLTLGQAIYTAESLSTHKMDYFYADSEGKEGDPIEIFNLVKRVDCMQDDPNFSLMALEIMVACGGPSIWIKIDCYDNVTVQCYWGQAMEIVLGDIGITLDEVKSAYDCLINR
ncbi:MAG: hypothetical protein LBQ77_08325 [Treponema sp.]|jgi:hypothetical protein|nr:hypothetical protein [Treponema sp.]